MFKAMNVLLALFLLTAFLMMDTTRTYGLCNEIQEG